MLEKHVYDDSSDSMEGVVVEVRLIAPCKQFAIKDNGISDRSALGLDIHKAKLHSFFFLRTIRVVTDVPELSTNLIF